LRSLKREELSFGYLHQKSRFKHTWRLSLGVKPTKVHFAVNLSPARGAIGSKIIPSLSRISNRGIVSALIKEIDKQIKKTIQNCNRLQKVLFK
jgi:hypothetical protein